jgi:hypothetical protein
MSKVKSKAVPVHAIKAYRGFRSTAALILILGGRCKRVVNITLFPLYPRERIPVPMVKESEWALESVWMNCIFESS